MCFLPVCLPAKSSDFPCSSLDIDRELCYFTIRISYIRFIFVYTKFWSFPIRL